MSKQDYNLIARSIFLSKSDNGINYSLRYLVNDLCNRFIADNPKFNAGKFKAACGLDEPSNCIGRI